jgi:hypothetical protein
LLRLENKSDDNCQNKSGDNGSRYAFQWVHGLEFLDNALVDITVDITIIQ